MSTGAILGDWILGANCSLSGLSVYEMATGPASLRVRYLRTDFVTPSWTRTHLTHSSQYPDLAGPAGTHYQ